MSDFLDKIKKLIKEEEVRISEHGYDELSEDNLTITGIISGIASVKVVEEYPDYPKGSCILVLQQDKEGNPVHVLWGVPKGFEKPAVLITAYRPDPERWGKDYLKRV
ncbi:MAG: DUF4258 domain-containing protein [Balneolaceae bacterium]|nr:DUF4258 domain-containing protein [Balneolaceae bacterium]